jgi:hypothetical protein
MNDSLSLLHYCLALVFTGSGRRLHARASCAPSLPLRAPCRSPRRTSRSLAGSAPYASPRRVIRQDHCNASLTQCKRLNARCPRRQLPPQLPGRAAALQMTDEDALGRPSSDATSFDADRLRGWPESARLARKSDTGPSSATLLPWSYFWRSYVVYSRKGVGTDDLFRALAPHLRSSDTSTRRV